MASNPSGPFITLVIVIFAVGIFAAIAPALLGPLGSMAKDSSGSDGSGFSVGDESIDRFANTAIVQIPTLMISAVGVWAVLALLLLLAYVGVV